MSVDNAKGTLSIKIRPESRKLLNYKDVQNTRKAEDNSIEIGEMERSHRCKKKEEVIVSS